MKKLHKKDNSKHLDKYTLIGNTIGDITNFFRGENYDYSANSFYYDTIKSIYLMRKDIFLTWLKKTFKCFLAITLAVGLVMMITNPTLNFSSGFKIMLIIFASSKIISLPFILKEYPIFKDLKNIIMDAPVIEPVKSKTKEPINVPKLVKKVPIEEKIASKIKDEKDILNDLLGIWLMLPKDSNDYLLIKNNIDFLQMLRTQMKNHEPVNMEQYDLVWSNLTKIHQKYMQPAKRKQRVLAKQNKN